MSQTYEFKRDIYYQTQEAIKNNKAVFLLGARKTGKTVCMKQLAQTLPDARYYDIKSMTDDDADDLRDEIVSSIQKNERRTYLVDETTYWLLPEKAIAMIANAYADYVNTNTKVVFSGSQSAALGAWAGRDFGGTEKRINVDFLSYPEWLDYTGLSEVSAETYNRFLMEARNFYKDFVSLDAYLQGCLDETVISNNNTSNFLPDNECDALDVPTLKNILYSTLVSLSDRPSLKNFFDAKEGIIRKIRSSFKEAYRAAGSDTVRQEIDNILSERIAEYSSTDFNTLKQGYIFLQKCGLVTLTYVSPETKNFEEIVDVMQDLCRRDENKIKNKLDLFEKVNICIKYPMFLVEIIKEALGQHFPTEIKGDILGQIVECQVRGLLPTKYSYEYHRIVDNQEREVDYVGFSKCKAIEISVRNKSYRELHFDDLPKCFEKILLTKDQHFTETNGLKRIPYYQYIYELSNRPNRSHTLEKTPVISKSKTPQETEQLSEKAQKASELMRGFAETIKDIPKGEEIVTSPYVSSDKIVYGIEKQPYKITIDFLKGKFSVHDGIRFIECVSLQGKDDDLWKYAKEVKKALKSYVKGKETPFDKLFKKLD